MLSQCLLQTCIGFKTNTPLSDLHGIYSITADRGVTVTLCSLAALQPWVSQSPQHLHGRNDGLLLCERSRASERWVGVFLAFIWILGWCLLSTSKKKNKTCQVSQWLHQKCLSTQNNSSLHMIHYAILCKSWCQPFFDIFLYLKNCQLLVCCETVPFIQVLFLSKRIC